VCKPAFVMALSCLQAEKQEKKIEIMRVSLNMVFIRIFYKVKYNSFPFQFLLVFSHLSCHFLSI
jgi:hypothetical protein